MTSATTIGSLGTRLTVDGHEYGGGRTEMLIRDSVLAGFTAEPRAVECLLPSDRLHPVRWFNGRALVSVLYADWLMRLEGLPPVRFGEVGVGAMVTFGDKPAPRVVPLYAGAGRPSLGHWWLCTAVTNNVAREVFATAWGEWSFIAPVHVERGRDGLRCRVEDRHGLWLELTASRTSKVRTSEDALISYGRRDDWLIAVHEHATMRSGTGKPGSARLQLGRHPYAELIRGLGLGDAAAFTRPMAAESEPSLSAFDEFVDILGPARHTEPAPTDLHDGAEAPFRITHPDGTTELVDQNLAQLPFPANAPFTAEPVTAK